MGTQIATTSAQVIELSKLNQWAILSGYISWAIVLVVIGYFAHAIVNRKRK